MGFDNLRLINWTKKQNRALQQFDRRRIGTYLLKLNGDFHNKGIEVYFECRTQEVHQRIRNIQFKGDLNSYCVDLCMIIYDVITTTSSEYMDMLSQAKACCQNNKIRNDLANDTSFFTLWVMQTIQIFYNHYANQVFLYHAPLHKVVRCLRATFAILNRLKNEGINIWIQIQNKLLQQVCIAIHKYWKRKTIQQIDLQIHNDNWISRSIKMTPVQFLNQSNFTNTTNVHQNSRSSSQPNSSKSCISFSDKLSPQSEEPETEEVRESDKTQSQDSIQKSGINKASSTIALNTTNFATIVTQIVNKDQSQTHVESSLSVRINITVSASFMYEKMSGFLDDLKHLFSNKDYPWMTAKLCGTVIDTIIAVLEDYCVKLLHTIQNNETYHHQPLSQIQEMSMISNVYHLVHDLLPRIHTKLKKLFKLIIKQSLEVKSKLSRLLQFRLKLTRLYKAQIKFVATKHAPLWVKDILMLETPTLTDSNNEFFVSETFCALIEQLLMLKDIIARHLSKKSIQSILSNCVEQILIAIVSYMHTQCKKQDSQASAYLLSSKFLAQLTIDIKFFSDSCKSYISPKTSKNVDLLINQISALMEKNANKEENPCSQIDDKIIDQIILKTYSNRSHLNLSAK